VLGQDELQALFVAKARLGVTRPAPACRGHTPGGSSVHVAPRLFIERTQRSGTRPGPRSCERAPSCFRARYQHLARAVEDLQDLSGDVKLDAGIAPAIASTPRAPKTAAIRTHVPASPLVSLQLTRSLADLRERRAFTLSRRLQPFPRRHSQNRRFWSVPASPGGVDRGHEEPTALGRSPASVSGPRQKAIVPVARACPSRASRGFRSGVKRRGKERGTISERRTGRYPVGQRGGESWWRWVSAATPARSYFTA
jgi:hypothetical protein